MIDVGTLHMIYNNIYIFFVTFEKKTLNISIIIIPQLATVDCGVIYSYNS